jgi:anti-sigma factor RsiW
MSGEQPSWEKLNAYVDGELPPRERAEVAAALAARPELAKSVAVLTKLKVAVGEATEAIAWDDILPPRESAQRGQRRRRLAVRLAVALSIGAMVMLIPWRAEDGDAWLTAPLGAHEAWVASGNAGLSEGGAGALLVGLATLGSGAEIPNLTAAKLTIKGVRFLPATDERSPAVHVAYGGTRGCRVTLWITPAPPGLDAEKLTLHQRGPYRVYGWRAGDLAYALISSVHPARFELIARTARKVTLERVQPDAETKTALRRSRKQSPPCQHKDAPVAGS